MFDLSATFNGRCDAVIWPPETPLRPASVHGDARCDDPGNRVDATSKRYEIDDRSVYYRTRRLFAVSAALVMVLVVFAVIPRDARAGTAQPLAQSLASQSVMYGPGWERIVNPDGTVEMHQLPTFQRYDGVWRPASALNRSNGDWPYLLTETSTSFAVNRLSRTFQQAKVSGATYDFRPETIKETVKIPMAPQSPLVSVQLSTTGLTVGIANGTITLKDSGGFAFCLVYAVIAAAVMCTLISALVCDLLGSWTFPTAKWAIAQLVVGPLWAGLCAFASWIAGAFYPVGAALFGVLGCPLLGATLSWLGTG